MNTFRAIFILIFSANFFSAQYLIVGKDSISATDFKKDYLYGLENSGIDKTIASTQEFLLIQQYAQDKKVDTTAYFKERMWNKINELHEKFFFPNEVSNPVLQNYIADSQTDREIQIFMVQKETGDTNDYQKIYNDVKSGTLTMQDAITKYTKGNSDAFYTKPGTIDNTIYAEVKTLPTNSYTKLIDNENIAAFAKVLKTRPSLGYMIFGTISYPNDDKAEEMKTKILADLKAGKKFEEVANLYGSTDNEKNNGGVVMGSPTFPDNIYEMLKNQKAGFYTQPVPVQDKYYIFNIYSVEPYELNDKTKNFYLREIRNNLYAEFLEEKLLAYLKNRPEFKEFPISQNLKKSYAAFVAHTNDSDVLYEYHGYKTTVGDLKKAIDPNKTTNITQQQWQDVFEYFENRNLLNAYAADFANRPDVRPELEQNRRMLFSDYVFSNFISGEVDAHPEWLTDYYNKNKSQFLWEKRAAGRVAVVSDSKLVGSIKKEIKDPKNWEKLKTEYDGKLNAENKILVSFQEGEMFENADIFIKYNVPFGKGVHDTKMGNRDVVIAIDNILEPTQMTEKEAEELVREAVVSKKIQEVVQEQKSKTNIVVQPEFITELEKSFKR
ncbi:MAG: peptidylprolyl isomerase [Flavobacteriaceae bacterium]|jgi:peptidyl-prolyl cis-trans isomerase SurA|nr:peptidylprolyl isomerase [Flavobacteriaceae bacterium]